MVSSSHHNMQQCSGIKGTMGASFPLRTVLDIIDVSSMSCRVPNAASGRTKRAVQRATVPLSMSCTTQLHNMQTGIHPSNKEVGYYGMAASRQAVQGRRSNARGSKRGTAR
jgi:hypothetical protein